MPPETAELTGRRVIVLTGERLPASRPGLPSPHLDDPRGFRMHAGDPIPAVAAEVHAATALCHVALEAGAHRGGPVLRMAARDDAAVSREQSLALSVEVLVGKD